MFSFFQKLLCGFTESKSMERIKNSFLVLQFKKSNSVGSFDVENLEKACSTFNNDLRTSTNSEDNRRCEYFHCSVYIYHIISLKLPKYPHPH